MWKQLRAKWKEFVLENAAERCGFTLMASMKKEWSNKMNEEIKEAAQEKKNAYKRMIPVKKKWGQEKKILSNMYIEKQFTVIVICQREGLKWMLWMLLLRKKNGDKELVFCLLTKTAGNCK